MPSASTSAARRRLTRIGAAVSPQPSVEKFLSSTTAAARRAASAAAATNSEDPWTTPGHPGFDGRSGTQLFDLSGKVAFVTGSSTGLGVRRRRRARHSCAHAARLEPRRHSSLPPPPPWSWSTSLGLGLGLYPVCVLV